MPSSTLTGYKTPKDVSGSSRPESVIDRNFYNINFCPRVKGLLEKDNILSTSLIKLAADKHQVSEATSRTFASQENKTIKT